MKAPILRGGGLGTKLAVSYVVAVVVIFVVTAVLIDQAARASFIDELMTTTQAESQAVAVALGSGPVDGTVRELSSALGVRISIINADGDVVADSSADPVTMDNHQDRPEVIEARVDGMGMSIRLSETIGQELLYVAVLDGDRVVRLAVPVDEVNDRMLPVRIRAVLGIIVVTLAGLVVVSILGRRTERIMKSLTSSVARIAAGQVPEDVLDEVLLDQSPDVAELSEAVRSMSDQIRARVDELEGEQQLRDRVLAALDEGVLLLRDGLVDYANPAARQMLGASIAADGRLRHHRIARMATGRVGPDRVTLGGRLVEVVVGPPADQVVVVLRDVTDRVRTEAIRRDFVADASHELKTPVAAIQAAAETTQTAAQHGDLTAVIHFSQQVEAAALRLGRIVSDLLDLSRLEAQELAFEVDDLVPILRDEVSAAELDHLVVTTDLHQVSARLSRTDIALAVRNLLSNAGRHTEPGGSVHVALREEQGSAVISVTDNGSGIPARDLPRIFERFYRVDAARSRHTGATGLGLAIVRHVAERHQGSVEVDSEFGSGSTFRIRIPINGQAQPGDGD